VECVISFSDVLHFHTLMALSRRRK